MAGWGGVVMAVGIVMDIRGRCRVWHGIHIMICRGDAAAMIMVVAISGYLRQAFDAKTVAIDDFTAPPGCDG